MALLRTLRNPPRPGGPFRPGFWRSPLRGPWFTSFLGLLLLVGIPVLFVTGLLSFLAYNPDLPFNSRTPTSFLTFQLFHWPTRPSWLYRVTQGTHVTLGLVLVPVVLAKLWSVIPKLFAWPPVTSPLKALERVSLVMLVGGVVFEFVTGILNIQYWYVFPGSFYRLHYYGAWVFIAGFVVHVTLKFPTMLRSIRARPLRTVLRTPTRSTEPDDDAGTGLVSTRPSKATISRRGAIGLVGAASLTTLVVTVGQSVGGPLRRAAVLAPRRVDPGTGPNGFQINKTARAVGISAAETGATWRLTIAGSRTVVLTREQLLALPQHTAHLAIACVEGWSSGDQEWEGIALRDLARMAGYPAATSVLVQSIEDGGYGRVTLRGNQIADPDSLLAFRVNGAELSLDHGYPARVIVPNNPGVHNTKWVRELTFTA
ncbi:molybdopterin-dependent oxidoreductase [Jatrophihabitans sp. YIM 134969]